MSASQTTFDGKYSAAGLTDGLISTLVVSTYYYSLQFNRFEGKI